jgi:predicted nucleotidyltransferase
MTAFEVQPRIKDPEPERMERFKSVLADAINTVENEGFPYLIGGSLAAAIWGRPTDLGDIDLIVDPREARNVLAAFDKAGFDAEEGGPQWLFKATKDEITVDIIFEMAGPLYLEPQMIERGSVVEIEGTRLRLMSPEDFILTQALALKEDTADYWFNALGVIASRELDWNYVIDMASRGPRKLLSLLILAQSEDLSVPDHVIREIFATTYGR